MKFENNKSTSVGHLMYKNDAFVLTFSLVSQHFMVLTRSWGTALTAASYLLLGLLPLAGFLFGSALEELLGKLLGLRRIS